MFGKGKARKTSTDRFVMASAGKAGNVFGGSKGGKERSKGNTPDPFDPRTLKVGKNARFKE